MAQSEIIVVFLIPIFLIMVDKSNAKTTETLMNLESKVYSDPKVAEADILFPYSPLFQSRIFKLMVKLTLLPTAAPETYSSLFEESVLKML